MGRFPGHLVPNTTWASTLPLRLAPAGSSSSDSTSTCEGPGLGAGLQRPRCRARCMGDSTGVFGSVAVPLMIRTRSDGIEDFRYTAYHQSHLRCDELQAIVQPLEFRMNPYYAPYHAAELKVEIGDASRLQWDCIRSRLFGQLMLQKLLESPNSSETKGACHSLSSNLTLGSFPGHRQCQWKQRTPCAA
jgi:hypothetical protein